jgi:hypothetical protein
MRYTHPSAKPFCDGHASGAAIFPENISKCFGHYLPSKNTFGREIEITKAVNA